MAGPEGEFTRAVVRHPGAVVVVPLVDDDVILVRQYRAAVGRSLLEVPAGNEERVGDGALLVLVLFAYIEEGGVAQARLRRGGVDLANSLLGGAEQVTEAGHRVPPCTS